MENQVIANRYEIERKIGAGGVARVYLARDRILGRQVALKILNPEVASAPDFVERFRREAQAAASLNHPNIVSVYDWDKDAQSYFMVMEYVAGKNLKEVIREGPLPERTALEMAAQIAAALEVAHQRGVIHRDVKPQNIMVMPDGRIKVADFGIARAAGLSQLTKTDVVWGTAHYLSPEQLQRQAADGRSDMYSLGVVLYEMLTGQEPFQGNSLVEVVMQHINQPAVSPRDNNPGISADSEAIVLRALDKNPEHRYPTAAAMQTALKHALSRLPSADEETHVQPAPVQSISPSRPHEPPKERATETVALAPARTRGVADRTSSSRQNSRARHGWLMAVPLLLALLVGGSVFLTRQNGSKPNHHASKGATVVATAKPRTNVGKTQGNPTASPSPAGSRSVATATSVAAPSTPVPTPPAASGSAQGEGHGNGNPGGEGLGHGNENGNGKDNGNGNTHDNSQSLAYSPPSGPATAVQQFYTYINSREFAQAAALWTSGMQAAHPPSRFIDERFQHAHISVTIGKPQVNGNQATVPVTVDDQEDPGSGRQSGVFSGTWYLIRVKGSWLLNSTSFG